MEAIFETIRERWGRLDFLLRSIVHMPATSLYGRHTLRSRSVSLGKSTVSLWRAAKIVLKQGDKFRDQARMAEQLWSFGRHVVDDRMGRNAYHVDREIRVGYVPHEWFE
jgi:hypothetical protein